MAGVLAKVDMIEDEEVVNKSNDFSAEVKIAIPEYTDPVRQNPSKETLNEALAKLLALEKKTRLAADVDSTLLLADAILDICRECNEWTILGDQVSLLCKRRAQLAKVVQSIIKKAVAYIDQTPDKETKKAYIATLRAVSDGKIFVELERARMTRTLSQMAEEEGDVVKAASLLQELQVETIGSMEMTEKAELLLEQIRLCLATKDYIRAEIIMNKVNVETLSDEKMQVLKIKHYNLCIGFYMNSNRYLSACRAYLHIYNTPSIKADEDQWKAMLAKAALLCVMSPFDAEVSDILGRLSAEKNMEELPISRELLKEFSTDELMAWPPKNEDELKKDDIFGHMEKGEERWADFHKRVVQHNLRVFAKYYTSVTTARAAELLSLDEKTLEKFLSDMVSSKQLYARVDRPAGIISFERKQTSNEIVNNWAADIEKLLGLVNHTTHLINKENMAHGINV